LIDLDVETPRTEKEKAAVGRLIEKYQRRVENDHRIEEKDDEKSSQVKVGGIVETKVVTENGSDKGFWIKARVVAIHAGREQLDLEVLNPQKWKVTSLAKGVPYKYVRAYIV